VLLVRLLPYLLLAENFFYLGEELDFFIVAMRFHKKVPCVGVADEAGLVLVCHMWSLEKNGVVAAQDCIVDVCHVRGSHGEDVGLFSGILWGRYQLTRAISPG
jgi:hypothetical protein